jgi:hypothetical protein
MRSVDPTPRLLAAAASLTGTGILMCRPEPSRDGILVGLLCLGLWAVFTLAARPVRRPAPARPVRPRMLEAVVVETPRAEPELLPAPRPAAGLLPGPPRRHGILPEMPPEMPPHPQRVVARYTLRRR